MLKKINNINYKFETLSISLCKNIKKQVINDLYEILMKNNNIINIELDYINKNIIDKLNIIPHIKYIIINEKNRKYKYLKKYDRLMFTYNTYMISI